MSDILVKDLAKLVKAPVNVLLKQLQEAGISVKGLEDSITEQQKLTLLNHIRTRKTQKMTTKKDRITLKRRTTSKIKVSGTHGRGKTVNIEIRRKKTFRKKGVGKNAISTQIKVSATSRSAQLAKQLESERKAREAAAKRNQQRKEQAKAQQKRKAAPPKTKPTPVATRKKASNPATKTTQPVRQKQQPKARHHKPRQRPVQNRPVEKKQVKKPRSTVQKAPKSTINNQIKSATPSLSLKDQRAAVAKAARAAAAAALKRRPSRLTIKKKTAIVAKAKAEVKPKVAQPTAAKPKAKVKRKTIIQDKPINQQPRRNRRRRKGRRGRGAVRVEQPDKHQFEKPTAPVVKEIEIPATIIVSDLAQKLATKATDVIMAMMKMGVMATINQSIDQDTAILVVEEMGHIAKPMQEMDDEAILSAILGKDSKKYKEENRPPVVTIMGHVDHGKTSLLDYIRVSRVAAGEAGGITQHIGAYHVDTPNGMVSFLDTPGHAAFTKMRARGAQSTDVVVLVVAADDGVMPQTKEAIKHARAANVPIVVAINKIDKENSNPERVKKELAQYEVVPEEWGGDDVFIEVSAKTGEGVEELLESILLVSEVLELTAPVEGPASGIVVEASIETGRGAVATILVQKGKLQKGDILLAGSEYGRIRAMFDENGKPIKTATPSIPVRVLGLSGAPSAGADVIVTKSERKARDVAQMRREKQRDTKFAAQQATKLSNLFNNIKDGENSIVNLLIKADVQGSLEVLRDSLAKLSTDEIEVKIISSGIGGINSSDVNLVVASNAIVIGFNVRADATARRAMSEAGVDVRYYSVIYDVVDDVKQAMSGLLSPEIREEFIGLAEVRDSFRSAAFGTVAGCLITEGVVRKGNPIRVLRDNVVIYTGELESLRRHKDDVEAVNSGTECGIAIKNYNDVAVGDQIECFEVTEVIRKI